MRNVAILIFDEVEVLDFCGPFEVFSVAGKHDDLEPFNTYTVAERREPVLARNSFSVNPHYTLDDCPHTDILVIPGGYGTRKEMLNPTVIEWIENAAQQAERVLSVCTGALLLAKAGVLDGLAATTHHVAFDLLEELAPNTEVKRTERMVDNGKVITSAGVSSGIDMSLHVVAKLMGVDQARETAHYIEYPWQPTKDEYRMSNTE